MFGKRKHYGGSLSEENFLGLGQGARRRVRLRPRAHDHDVQLQGPAAPRQPLAARARAQRTPRTASRTPSSSSTRSSRSPPRAPAASSGAGSSLTEYLYSDGDKAVSGARAPARTFSLWGGMRLPGDGVFTNRLTLGVFYDAAEFADWRWVDGSAVPARPEGRDMRGRPGRLGAPGRPLGAWSTGSARGSARRTCRSGPNWSVTVGFSLPAFGGDRTRIPLAGQFNARLADGRAVLVVERSAAAGGSSEGGVGQRDHPPRGRHRPHRPGRAGAPASRSTSATTSTATGSSRSGADTGLRGWDPDTFDGTSRAVTNLEWRHQLDRRGAAPRRSSACAVFVDAGKTWNPRVGPSTEGVAQGRRRRPARSSPPAPRCCASSGSRRRGPTTARGRSS